ncbi:Restnol dehydrogenase [Entamoeba marina]
MLFALFVIITILVIIYCIYMYCRGGVNTHLPDLTGKVVVVTGTNRGIGYKTIKTLAKLNATVVCCCRHEEAQIRVNMIISKKTSNSKLEFVKCDLMDLDCVKQAAHYINNKYHKVDILITNAGIMCTPFMLSKQNYEAQMATNHIGHAALIMNLLPSLRNAESPRIVAVSSLAHRFTSNKNIKMVIDKSSYKPAFRYFESKLAVAMFIKEFSNTYPNITVTHVHPGLVYSNLWKYWHPWLMWTVSPFFKIFWKNPQEACQTALHCALADKIVSGEYYADCKISTSNSLVNDVTSRQKLWRETLNIIDFKG